ncbi:MAG TPA: hypothetical protein VM221_07100 [Armatimonadota bacterium]|nr:hypothetical protein [Armatimonadota bacterium]
MVIFQFLAVLGIIFGCLGLIGCAGDSGNMLGVITAVMVVLGSTIILVGAVGVQAIGEVRDEIRKMNRGATPQEGPVKGAAIAAAVRKPHRGLLGRLRGGKA